MIIFEKVAEFILNFSLVIGNPLENYIKDGYARHFLLVLYSLYTKRTSYQKTKNNMLVTAQVLQWAFLSGRVQVRCYL